MNPATPGGTVVDRFLAVAEEFPGGISVCDRHGSATYGGLRRQIAAIAARLVDAGAQPGDPVAVCVPRGIATVAALLGVLYAGCVYLPVDPDWPDGRVQDVLADAGVRHAVHDDTSARRLPLADAGLVSPQQAGDAPSLPESRAVTTGGAYLLYTSGSTGKPKGVRIGHRALAQLIDALRKPSRLAPGRSALASTTTTFDISLVELILPLCVGATCVVADSDTVRDPAALAEFIAARSVDYVQATPTLWAPLLDHLTERIPVAMCAGEPMSARLRDRLLAASRHAFNGYGPTETTVYATIWPLAPDGPVSVGRPLPGVSVWVLDRDGRPCPAEATGSLYISGTTVADGYLNQPELTAERFRDGLPDLTAERAYRSGDLASWGTDGQLYLHGREDDQIKLRGFRIEPGEIEAVLSTVDGVDAAVVVPFSRGQDQRSLVAFVQAGERRGGPVPRQELEAMMRAELAARLPEYMRPRIFQFIDTLPVTAAGKADRRALAAMVRVPDSEAAATGSAQHERIAELFREVLGSAGVGADDNFFDLGGDSVGAVLLVARLRKAFGKRLTLNDFVADPTVRGVAVLAGSER
jgi:amino acid adenylation domain-containing protein